MRHNPQVHGASFYILFALLHYLETSQKQKKIRQQSPLTMKLGGYQYFLLLSIIIFSQFYHVDLLLNKAKMLRRKTSPSICVKNRSSRQEAQSIFL